MGEAVSKFLSWLGKWVVRDSNINRQPGDGVARITEPHHPIAIPAESCM